MYWFLVISSVLSYAAATPSSFSNQRIVGGELTTIDRYPYQAGLLWGINYFEQHCGATILNSRSALTAAHCFWLFVNPNFYQIRVGSSFANSGGIVHHTNQIIIHPNYNSRTFDNDVGIVRSASVIVFNDFVRPAAIAGPRYDLADNEAVLAIGWGKTMFNGPLSEQLRHVQVWTINQSVCRARYRELGDEVTNNMLCSGWLDVGGRDQCQGDSGGPLIHRGVVVGICSWGEGCAHPRYPGVNARVSSFSTWIQGNA